MTKKIFYLFLFLFLPRILFAQEVEESVFFVDKVNEEQQTSTPLIQESEREGVFVGEASWYKYKGGYFAASVDFPKGTRLKVTNTNNGKWVVVTVNDYGPDKKAHPKRVIDLDKIAFQELASLGAGVINVSVEKAQEEILAAVGQDISLKNKEEEKFLTFLLKNNLSDNLKGRIVLQVESSGQAWYLNDREKKAYYMSNGTDAFNILSELGIGISNKNLEKIKNNKQEAKKYKGLIFLQVEDLGQAYYIDFDGNVVYLKDGQSAFDLMKKTGLGISNKDLKNLSYSIENNEDLINEELIGSFSSIVFDEENDKVLWSKNQKEQMPMASLTKVIAIKTFLDIKNQDLEKIVSYKKSDEDFNALYCSLEEVAKINLKEGEELKIKDLLYAALVGSANNAVETLVRNSGVSRYEFIEKMNFNVKKWGAEKTKIIEPSGLSEKNVTSVKDYALITKEVFKDKLIEKISSSASYSFASVNFKRVFNLKHTNSLTKDSHLKIAGTKTGYLNEAGYCLMTRINTDNNKKIIVVVMKNKTKSGAVNDTKVLLKEYANINFS